VDVGSLWLIKKCFDLNCKSAFNKDAVQGQWEGKLIRAGRSQIEWFGTEKLFLFHFFRWIGMANAIGWRVGSFS